MTHVAILIPGIMGSVLECNGEVIWPGAVSELLFPYSKMRELTQENLVAIDVIRSVSISEQYDELIGDLETCGFREDGDPPTLVVCPYDWRKDNRLAAKQLADLLDRTHAQHNGKSEISLVAHSMGGLISRYYLESGEYINRPAFRAIRQLITLGTPHRGSPFALTAALGEEKRLWLNADQVLQIVNDHRYPSVYQLLPPRGEPFAWDRESGANYDAIDIYDARVAKAMGLVEANLRSAETFHQSLDHQRRPPLVRYFTFVGTRQTMASYVLVRKVRERYQVEKVESDDAGDGTVPTWSGALTGLQGQPVGGEHGDIYKNDDLRRTLAGLLGKQGVLAAHPQRVEVAIREKVCHPESTVHIALTFSTGSNKLHGELRVQKAKVDSNGKLIELLPPISHSIQYAGLTAEKLGISLTAPAAHGIYQIAFYPSGQQSPAGLDHLFVQKKDA